MDSTDIEAIARFRRGADPRAVVDEMEAEGFDRRSAEAAVERVRRRITKDDRDRGLVWLVAGLVVFGAGFALTLTTYLTGGRSYVLVWGPMVVGLILILRGLGQISDAGKYNHGRPE